MAPKKLFSSPKKEQIQLSVVILGDVKVGKSMMLRRYLGKLDKTEVAYDGTIEDEVQVAEKVNGTSYLVNYIDTGGKCVELVPEWIAKAAGCLVVYDPTKRSSFLWASRVCDMIKKSRKLPVVVVANKVYSGGRRQVSVRDGERLSVSVNGSYLETCTRRDSSNKAFKAILSLLAKGFASSPPISLQDVKLKKDSLPQGKSSGKPCSQLLASGFKVALLGSPKVGKSHLLSIHLDKKSEGSYDSTIEDRYIKNEVTSGQSYPVEYIDTGGDDACEEMTSGWVNEADGLILVFKTDDRESLERVKSLRSLSPSKPAVLVANTLSSSEQRKISRREALKVASFFQSELVEISTEREINIENVFEKIADRVLETKRDSVSPI